MHYLYLCPQELYSSMYLSLQHMDSFRLGEKISAHADGGLYSASLHMRQLVNYHLIDISEIAYLRHQV